MKYYIAIELRAPEARKLDMSRAVFWRRREYRSHITVAGPYSQEPLLDESKRLLEGREVSLGGIATFWDTDTQNTVFVQAKGECLFSVWNKPQYPAFNPHVTVYDGMFRSEAIFARDVLREYVTPWTETIIPDQVRVICKDSQCDLYRDNEEAFKRLGNAYPEDIEHLCRYDQAALVRSIWRHR